MMTNQKLYAYIGTYTTGESKGIYSFSLDPTLGTLGDLTVAAEIDSPTYLTIDNENAHLYSVAKIGAEGGVASFKILDDLTLSRMNEQLSEGSPPCHVSLDPSNTFLFSANYHKGRADVYPLDEIKQLQNASSSVLHEGSGPNKSRQEKAHAHFAGLTPDESYVCVVDLGTDKIALYTFSIGDLALHKEITVAPGSGPRHIRFHPNGKFAYVNAELSSELLVFEYDGENGDFKHIQTISTLPATFDGENTGGALHLSSDGRFLYASNRGHDSIAIFSIDEQTGRVALTSHVSTEGAHPRDFTLDPTGNYIIVGNKDSNNIVLFSRDQASGALTKTGKELTVPNPVCIKFLHVD